MGGKNHWIIYMCLQPSLPLSIGLGLLVNVVKPGEGMSAESSEKTRTQMV